MYTDTFYVCTVGMYVGMYLPNTVFFCTTSAASHTTVPRKDSTTASSAPGAQIHHHPEPYNSTATTEIRMRIKTEKGTASPKIP
jgi:hypothetical protein